MSVHAAKPEGSWRPLATARRANVRIVVRAADPLVASGLHAMLRATHGIELVHPGDEPDVTVAAVGNSGLGDLLRTCMTSKLVLIVEELSQAELRTAVEHGVTVLVPRSEASTKTRLLQAIADACEGRGDLAHEHLRTEQDGLGQALDNRSGSDDAARSALTPREAEVIRLLADGLDTAEIAERLIYSERTVKNILYNLLTRLSLRNRAHAVAHALRHRLI